MRLDLGGLWRMLNIYQTPESAEEEKDGEMKESCEGYL